MKLKLNRILRTNNFTIGELYVDGEKVCDTLEDVVRPLPKDCPNTSKGEACKCKEKKYGETAVPAGTYPVILSYSQRFKKVMPELLNVPHFLGIRIHSGNKVEDSEGCILVGEWDGKTVNWISDSVKNYNKLLALLKKAKDDIEITINNI